MKSNNGDNVFLYLDSSSNDSMLVWTGIQFWMGIDNKKNERFIIFCSLSKI